MRWLVLLQSVHGYFGVAALALLVHPAILLRTGKPMSRGQRWAVALATIVTAVAFSAGIYIYEDYRSLVKRTLFTKARDMGYLFESKEHLAFCVASLALGAGIAALMAPRSAGSLRRGAAVLFGVAAVLCFVVVTMGLAVSSVAGFAT